MLEMRIRQPRSNGKIWLTTQVDTQEGGIRVGTKVVARDGTAGRVAFLMHDRRTREPTHLVVRRGWFWSRLIEVPLNLIVETRPDRIGLSVDMRQFEQLPEYRADGEIADDVWLALVGDAAFAQNADFGAIHVDVLQRVVELRGHVRGTDHKHAATRIARGVPGVEVVHNYLIADDDLRARVEHTLVSDPVLQIPEVRAEADLGVIHVYTPNLERGHATRIRQLVGQIPGVERVDVKIQFAEPERSDAQPARFAARIGEQSTGDISQD
jgi:hypothetical protein